MVLRFDHRPGRLGGSEKLLQHLASQRHCRAESRFVSDALDIDDGSSAIRVGFQEGFGHRRVLGTRRRRVRTDREVGEVDDLVISPGSKLPCSLNSWRASLISDWYLTTYL